jgi:hypothetical protein
MGYKDFQPGESFDGDDIMDFLMNQQVMIFTGGTAEREAELTSPIHGMVTYIGTADGTAVPEVFQYYNGTAWEEWP